MSGPAAGAAKTHPHDPRRGPPAAPHDPGDLLRARLARAGALHAVTLALYAAALVRAPDAKDNPIFLCAAAAGLAAVSAAALLATLRLSPDPDRGRELTAWLAGLSPRVKGWLCGVRGSPGFSS